MSQSVPSGKSNPDPSILIQGVITVLVTAIVPMAILITSLVADLPASSAMVASVICQLIGVGIAFRTYGSVKRELNLRSTARVNATPWTNREVPNHPSTNSTSSETPTSAILQDSTEFQDKIQTSIKNLVSELEEIAAGNLMIVSEVNEDITGPIAKSVNHMTSQLRSIVQRVETAAREVTSFASHLHEASTTLSEESDAQAATIAEASQQLLEMTEAFHGVTELAKESEGVAVEARQTASNGLKAVSDTIDGMQRIRDQVQSTSKRIKLLGESSQEIGEIVQLISDIADRTSILALNASIQAAMAGDAGQGFAIVAQEIEGLAERSTDATKQVSKLIRAIQNETSEVISDMEESTREVVLGSELASQAGSTLFEVDSVSDQLVELIQSSSVSVLEQALIVNQINSSMSEIAESSKSSAEKNRESTRYVQQLQELVTRLRTSVSQFTVADREELAENPSASDRLPQQTTTKKKDKSGKKRKRGFQKRTRKVSPTMISDIKPVSGRAAETTASEMEASLLRQVREANSLLDESSSDRPSDSKQPGKHVDNALSHSEDQQQSSRTVTRTIMLDE